jgi:hypothetical protein
VEIVEIFSKMVDEETGDYAGFVLQVAEGRFMFSHPFARYQEAGSSTPLRFAQKDGAREL